MSSLLRNLSVVLGKTKFPENIGMAARACANMGCGALHLVAPEWHDPDKARPLATHKGESVLDAVSTHAALPDALAHTVFSVGTTARVGGWRRDILTPEQAAQEVVNKLAEGPVALVFGPEDRGLDNTEIESCSRLVTIPTDGASSLNVAQAVLILVYECLKAASAVAVGRPDVMNDPGAGSRRITHAEQEVVFSALRETLLGLDYLKGNNPDYFLMPVRRFLGKNGLRRHEMDMLMGVCRQINGLLRRLELCQTENAPVESLPYKESGDKL